MTSASPPAKAPSSQWLKQGRKDCQQRKSGAFLLCNGTTPTTCSIGAKSVLCVWRTFSWATYSELWSACIDTTLTALTSGCPFVPPVPAAGLHISIDSDSCHSSSDYLPFRIKYIKVIIQHKALNAYSSLMHQNEVGFKRMRWMDNKKFIENIKTIICWTPLINKTCCPTVQTLDSSLFTSVRSISRNASVGWIYKRCG